MTEVEIAFRRWRDSLPSWARQQLVISTKERGLQPLRLNAAQLALHETLEKQMRETGRVRAVICKARQLGLSTYIAARFYHRLVFSKTPMEAFVLAHDESTAHHLSRMVATFHDNIPPSLRLATTGWTDSQRVWENNSRYRVRTASTPGGGRGMTPRLYHSSETAYQEHAEAHELGSAQGVPDMDSEMLYESTARGQVGPFYEKWRDAEDERNGYLPLFYPWTMAPEYAIAVPDGFVLDETKPNDVIPSERDYAEEHGVSLAQMAWRRARIQSWSGDGSLKFSSEYPITANEAFGGTGADAFFSPRHIAQAKERTIALTEMDYAHPLIVGVDPAPSHGNSATAIAWRRGRICYKVQRLYGMEQPELLDYLVKVLKEDSPSRMSIDESEGYGEALVDHLRRYALGAGRVMGVHFGHQAQEPKRYANRKAEMAARTSWWLARDAAIVNEQSSDPRRTLAQELLTYKRDLTMDKVLRLEPKYRLLARGFPSPDGADALFLTFSHPEPSPIPAETVYAPHDVSFTRRRDEHPDIPFFVAGR